VKALSSLTGKLGLYATLISLLALAAGVVPLLSAVHYHQLLLLDGDLAEDAEDLVRDLKNYRGAPLDPRRPLREDFIPAAFDERYLVVEGPEGQVLYQSPTLRGADLGHAEDGSATLEIGGKKWRVVSKKIPPYRIHLASEIAYIERFEKNLVSDILLVAPFVATLIFIGGMWLGRRAVAPVAEITRAAERINAHNLDERLPIPPTQDEIAELSAVINRTFDRLQISYNTASRFSADASHQLKTPLTILRAGLDHLSTSAALGEEDQAEIITLRKQVRRLTTLIEDLLLLAQADAGALGKERETCDLRLLLGGLLDDLEVLLVDRDITLTVELPELLTVSANAAQLGTALQSLTENSAKYTPDGGSIRVTGGMVDGSVRLAIANSGPLVKESDRAEIFERFNRGSRVGENIRGHGLGLNIARELIRAHGGNLQFDVSVEGWNEFIVTLPAVC
jgi:two-component system heavy metal sensor histidine kinase CusS